MNKLEQKVCKRIGGRSSPTTNPTPPTPFTIHSIDICSSIHSHSSKMVIVIRNRQDSRIMWLKQDMANDCSIFIRLLLRFVRNLRFIYIHIRVGRLASDNYERSGRGILQNCSIALCQQIIKLYEVLNCAQLWQRRWRTSGNRKQGGAGYENRMVFPMMGCIYVCLSQSRRAHKSKYFLIAFGVSEDWRREA